MRTKPGRTHFIHLRPLAPRFTRTRLDAEAARVRALAATPAVVAGALAAAGTCSVALRGALAAATAAAAATHPRAPTA